MREIGFSPWGESGFALLMGGLLMLIMLLLLVLLLEISSEKDYEDDHKDPPPMPLKHFGLEQTLKCTSSLFQNLGDPLEIAHFSGPLFHGAPVMFTFTAECTERDEPSV